MTSNGLKHQANLREWAVAIQECRSSGQSVKQWCRNRGITTTTYYIQKLMNILDRDFSDHQIIIASIYDYSLKNLNRIEMGRRVVC